MRVAANKLNKQSQTGDEVWSSGLGVGEVLTTLPFKTALLKTFTGGMLALETKQSGGKILPHSVLRGRSVSRGSIAQKAQKANRFNFTHIVPSST